MYGISFVVWGRVFVVICGVFIFDVDGVYLEYF